MDLGEVEAGDLRVVGQHQLALELALVRQHRDNAQLRAVQEVVARHVQLTRLWVQCDRGRAQPTRELVEHTRVIDARRVAHDAQDAIRIGLRYVKHVLLRGKG